MNDGSYQPHSNLNSEGSYVTRYNSPTQYDSNEIIFVGDSGEKQYVVKRNQTADSNYLQNFRTSSLSSLSSVYKWLSIKRAAMLKNIAATEARGEDVNHELSQCLNGNPSFEKKVLTPYSNILKLLGMRNFGCYDNTCHKILSWLWTFIVFLIILSGYIINIILCKRSKDSMDRKNIDEVCINRTLSFNYLEGMCRSSLDSTLPSLIHFVAIVYSFWVFRIKHSEQVEALVQKALVIQPTGTNPEARNSFVQRLKIVYATGYIFLFLLFTFTVTNSYFGKSLVWWKCTNDKVYAQQDNNGERQRLLDHYFQGMLVAIPSFAIFIFLTPILLNFNIQARLIDFLIHELRTTMREKRSTLRAMMQEAHDISTFVHKMNSESSPAMSFILFYLAYGIFVDMYSILETIDDAEHISNIFSNAGCSYLTDKARDTCRDIKWYGQISFCVVIARDIVLIIMFIATVYQGCKIATSHKRLFNQALETRVFGHTPKDTSEELDSFQHYLRDLRMRAKIFQYPMETKRLLFPMMVLTLFFLSFNLYYQFI